MNFNKLPRDLKYEILFNHCITLVPQILCLNKDLYKLLIDKVIQYYKNVPPFALEVIKYLNQSPNQFYLFYQSKRFHLDHFIYTGSDYTLITRFIGKCIQISPIKRKYDSYSSNINDVSIKENIITISNPEAPHYDINLYDVRVNLDIWNQYQLYKNRANLLKHEPNYIKTKLLTQLNDKYQTYDLNNSQHVLMLYQYLYTNSFIITHIYMKIDYFSFKKNRNINKYISIEWDENGKLFDKYQTQIDKYKQEIPILYKILQSKINKFI